MSKQPVILPTSSRRYGQRGNISRTRALFILVVALVVLAVLFNFTVTAFSSSQTPITSATPAPTVTPTPSATATPEPSKAPVFYADCSEVWKVLGRPIFKEDPGYRLGLDWDANGIGCEDNPATPANEAKIDWASVREHFKNNLNDLRNYVAPKASSFWDQAKNFLSH